MNCAELNGLLDLLMDDALSEEQRRALAAHGHECPECAAEIRRTLQMKALFDEMEPEADVPLAVQAKWRGAIRQAAAEKKRKRLYRWAATAAAAVVALTGVGLALNGRLSERRQGDVPMAAQMSVVLEADETVEAGAAEAAGVAEGAVIEADGGGIASNIAPAQHAVPAAREAAFYEVLPELTALPTESELPAPACELRIQAEDVSATCKRVLDLAQEYDGEAQTQYLEDGGAILYVELPADNAGDFASAVIPMDRSGEEASVPELSGEGRVLVLLEIRESVG